jgi:4-coumarate--CoA ligase
LFDKLSFSFQIVSEQNNKICDIGEVGELFFQGPTVMKGYLDNEAATKDSIIEGWLRSGDLGFVDEDGYYYIIDRIKEIIKYQGYQVKQNIKSIILF